MTDATTRAEDQAKAQYESICEMVAALECDYERLQVRSGWRAPGDDAPEPEEFYILLCTGGPAVRIRGELDPRGEPTRAWIEYQDWFEPWKQYFDTDQATLLVYCRCFYFGE